MRGPHNIWRLVRTGATFERSGAMRAALDATGHGGHFDGFVLSDTTEPETAVEEERLFEQMRHLFGGDRAVYRRRERNTVRRSRFEEIEKTEKGRYKVTRLNLDNEPGVLGDAHRFSTARFSPDAEFCTPHGAMAMDLCMPEGVLGPTYVNLFCEVAAIDPTCP